MAPLPLCPHGGNGWCLAELSLHPRWEEDLEAEQRQEGPGVLGVMRRLTAKTTVAKWAWRLTVTPHEPKDWGSSYFLSLQCSLFHVPWIPQAVPSLLLVPSRLYPWPGMVLRADIARAPRLKNCSCSRALSLALNLLHPLPVMPSSSLLVPS